MDETATVKAAKRTTLSPQVLHTLLTAVSAVGDELERARLIATGLPALLPCHFSGVALMDDKEDHWTLVAQHDGVQLPAAAARQILNELEPLLRDAFSRGNSLVDIGDQGVSSSHLCASIEKLDVRRLVAVPLRTARSKLGTLLLGSADAREFAREELDYLSTLADQLSIGIDNLRLYEVVQRAHDELEIRVKDRTAELSAATIRLAELQALLEQENVYLQEEIKTQHNFDEIIGESPAIKKVLADVEIVAGTDANVLITGETGTGKELLARAVHNLSPRKDKALIKVNCASIPTELFESEFFGHVRGAFTGAIKERLGRFQLADGGTLFLDEVCEIPVGLQSKLLRVIQEGEYERVGEEKTRAVDVRIIAATNRNLDKEISSRRFRSDLYFRLNVFPIESPPLSARLEDVPLLTKHFVTQACRRFGVAGVPIPQSQIERLQSYDWPGNIRELQNVIERAVIASRAGNFHCELPSKAVEGEFDEPLEPLTPRPSATGVLTYAELKQQEHDNVLTALIQTNWKVWGSSGAAELLGVKPSTLSTRIKVLGIQRPD